MFNGGFMLLSALVSLIYQDGVTFQIFTAGIVTLIIGVISMVFTRLHKKEINKREGYIVVTFGWLVMSLAGTLPLFLQVVFLVLQMLFLKLCLVLPLPVLLF